MESPRLAAERGGIGIDAPPEMKVLLEELVERQQPSDGEGIPKSLMLAYKWISMGAAQGD